jgi:hypothetical protein
LKGEIKLAHPTLRSPLAQQFTRGGGSCHPIDGTALPARDSTTCEVVEFRRNTAHADAMNDITDTIDKYLAAYGEPDDLRRLQLIGGCFAADATLADPPFTVTGHDELAAGFASVQAQFPGHIFARTSAVDEHHGAARYAWELRGENGVTAVAGQDFVRFNPDGLLTSVVGFFGEIPERSDK